MKKVIIVAIIAFIGVGAWLVVVKTKTKEVGIGFSVLSPVEREATVVVGTVGSEPEEEIEEYQPFIDYLARKLTNFNIKTGEVVVAASPAEMAKFVRQGKVDLYIDSSFPTYVVDKLADSEPLVSRWKKGVEKYHSVIFVKRDQGIASLDDLRGRIIAFESANSTSGYFLPKADLLKRGYKLTFKEKPTDPVAPDEIGYYFTEDEEKVVTDVSQGVAAAGGTNEDTLRELIGEASVGYQFLLTTADVFRHVVTVRGDLDQQLKETIKNVLLEANKNPEGQAVLEAFSKTAKFTAFEPNPEAAFAAMMGLAELVEEEIIRQ